MSVSLSSNYSNGAEHSQDLDRLKHFKNTHELSSLHIGYNVYILYVTKPENHHLISCLRAETGICVEEWRRVRKSCCVRKASSSSSSACSVCGAEEGMKEEEEGGEAEGNTS